MPITITIPAGQLYSESENRFYKVEETTVELEHSLVALSKWESKWHKPFLTKDQKTRAEVIDYFRCMCLTPSIEPLVFNAIKDREFVRIMKYIDDPMTATTITHHSSTKRGNTGTVTSELIYYWMGEYNISKECEWWHINRLFKLIEITSVKRQPEKKMSKRDIAAQNKSLNAMRRARHGSRG